MNMLPRQWIAGITISLLILLRGEKPKVVHQQIFEKMLVPQLPLAPEVSTQSLAEISDGLSGGDLRTIVINAAAKAVSRRDSEQVVKQADFEQAIEETLRAKQEVSSLPIKTRVSEEEVPVSELSEDDKAKYDQAVS